MFDAGALLNARVSAIHPSKNILLPAMTASSAVIDAIAKLNISKIYDVQLTKHRNGTVLQLHNNSIDIAFYDKVSEMQQVHKSIKRSVEREPYIESSIVTAFVFGGGREVLRYEVRLNKRRKVKEVFKSLDTWTLESILSSNQCEKLLKEHWSKLYNSIDYLSMDTRKPYEMAQSILATYRNKSLKSNLVSLASVLIIEQAGTRKFRSLVEANYDQSTWYRLYGNISVFEPQRREWMNKTNNDILEFMPITKKDLTPSNLTSLVGFDKLSAEEIEEERV